MISLDVCTAHQLGGTPESGDELEKLIRRQRGIVQAERPGRRHAFGPEPVERPYAPGKLIPTDAKVEAPLAGRWFHEQFLMMVANANPEL